MQNMIVHAGYTHLLVPLMIMKPCPEASIPAKVTKQRGETRNKKTPKPKQTLDHSHTTTAKMTSQQPHFKNFQFFFQNPIRPQQYSFYYLGLITVRAEDAVPWLSEAANCTPKLEGTVSSQAHLARLLLTHGNTMLTSSANSSAQDSPLVFVTQTYSCQSPKYS